MRLPAVARGIAGSDEEIKRVIALAVNQGERFAWLKAGTGVRIVKYSVNGGFAAQVQLLDDRDPIPAKQRYWIDSCYLTTKDVQDQALWHIATNAGCTH